MSGQDLGNKLWFCLPLCVVFVRRAVSSGYSQKAIEAWSSGTVKPDENFQCFTCRQSCRSEQDEKKILDIRLVP